MFSKRQQQIIESAIKIIAEKGVQNLTTKNLADEIGITEPALYRHFKNKLNIMESILIYFQEVMRSAIDELHGDGDSIQSIRCFYLAHLRIMNLNPYYAMVIFSEANFRFDDYLMSKMSNMMNRSQKALENSIQSGQKKNELVTTLSSLSISRLIIGSLRLLITQWSISGMIFDLESEGKKLCDDILKLVVQAKPEKVSDY